METIFYNLDARRVSTCDMASGETAPQCRSYAVLRKVEQKRADQGGKVLDLAAYRRKLEAEEAWDEDERWAAVGGRVLDAPPIAPKAPAASQPVSRRAHHAGFALDFFATLAILVMATVVVVGFLPFL